MIEGDFWQGRIWIEYNDGLHHLYCIFCLRGNEMNVYSDGNSAASSGAEVATDQSVSQILDDAAEIEQDIVVKSVNITAGEDLSDADSAISTATLMEDRGPFWDAELSRYTLQPVMIRSETESFAPHIFYKVLAGHVTPRNDGVKLAPGAKMGFNNYVNSFYAAYWLQYTGVRAISLSGMLSGHGILHLFKSMPSGRIVRVGSYPVGLKGKRAPFHIHFDLYGFFPTDGGAGRYFFDLEAISEMDVEKISFTSFVPPVRDANFSIGIHAYRNDGRVTNLVMTLEKYMRVHPNLISDVFVQLSSDNDSDTRELYNLCEYNSAFNVFKMDSNENSGEIPVFVSDSIRGSSSSYHVMMDDSAFLDPYIIGRMRAFCSYANDEMIIGAPVMDMKRPNMIQDSGTKLDDWGKRQMVGGELDAASHLDAAFYDKLQDVDYNNLWFACVPKAVVAKVGIPSSLLPPNEQSAYIPAANLAPEYKVVSLPGIFIWRDAIATRHAHALQELLLPDVTTSDPLSADLYLRLEGAAQGILDHPAYRDEPHKGLPLPLHGVVSFDSYLNTFYESYWQEAAALQTVCLEVEVFGRVRMHILRHAPIGGVRSIVQVEFGVEGMSTHHVVEIPTPLLAAERFKPALGRIWCGFEGWSSDARFISGRWATWDEPKQQRRVAVVMCTFNKPKDVIRNLALARDIFRQESALARFILVDQGSKKVYEDPEFAAVASGPNWSEQLKIVTQGNLGGAGGFTRGIIEGFADPSITDVLLLDDDIVLEPRVLQRLAVLLQHLKKPHMIGGQMFDLFYRGVMHAHAERANFDNLSYEPITPHGVDMTHRGANDLFLETVVGNYNGWWTCCIPREAVQAVGLPLPFFVRCDDSEFGSRLSAAKFPMITFPGIFVWHEPFYAKISEPVLNLMRNERCA